MYFLPFPSKGVNIDLVCRLVLNVSSDRVFVQTEVGQFHSDQEFMILDNDVEECEDSPGKIQAENPIIWSRFDSLG